MIENETQYIDEEDISDDDYFDEQDLRVINILAPGLEKTLEDIPTVNSNTIKKYYHYLEEKLDKQLSLTGRESLGYFSWEERFEWGVGDKSEHNQLRKTNASYEDKYQLMSLIINGSSERILAKVVRSGDQRIFDIPLEDLEACKQTEDAWQSLEDYSYWFENFNY